MSFNNTIKCSGYAWPLTTSPNNYNQESFEKQQSVEEYDEHGRRILNVPPLLPSSSTNTTTNDDNSQASDEPIINSELILSQAREYQKELVEHCKQENTIIVAPTGAGKTFISALLIHHMLNLNPLKKVLFIVNQISLVEQQARALREFGVERVGAFHGEKKSIKNWKLETRGFTVLVCTIQIILNVLQYTDIFDDLQLFIFDECHHAHSNHPFKVLMRDYYKPRKHAGLSVPRVLGLSATPAAKNTIAETLLKLLQLGHDLDCTVRQVEKNDDELSSFVFTPPMKVISVDMDKSSARLRDFIFDAIRGVKIILLETISSDGDVDIDDSKFGTDEANEWLDSKMNHITGSYEKDLDNRNLDDFIQYSKSKQNENLISTCKTLSVLNESLMINDHRSCNAAWKHLLKFLSSIPIKEVGISKNLDLCGISEKSYQYEKSLGEIPRHCSKRYELAKLLKQYKETGKELRALIFVKTRIGCREMMEFLNSDTDLNDYLKVDIILGKSGMTSNQQNVVLDNFRKGIVNTLISTSVSEEGIDIPNCSLVIRLDGVETTRTMIQSRGRARSEQSEFYCIHHSNSIETKSSYGKYQMQEQKMIISIDLLTKSEKIHPDLFYRKLNLQSIGLKQMVTSHIFEYIWNNKSIYKVEDTVLKLFEFTEKTITQSTVLTLTCEKLFGVKPIFQVVKCGHLFFARILIKINNYDRSLVDYGLQAGSYFVLTSSSMFKSKQEAKNTASLEALKKFLERDLAIFPSSTWTEVYKERYRHTVVVETEPTPVKLTGKLPGKHKNSTVRIVDENIFKQKVNYPNVITVLHHHCKINYGDAPIFEDTYIKGKLETSCTVKNIGTVKGAIGSKKDSKKDAALKMCETIFQTSGYFDITKHEFNKN